MAGGKVRGARRAAAAVACLVLPVLLAGCAAPFRDACDAARAPDGATDDLRGTFAPMLGSDRELAEAVAVWFGDALRPGDGALDHGSRVFPTALGGNVSVSRLVPRVVGRVLPSGLAPLPQVQFLARGIPYDDVNATAARLAAFFDENLEPGTWPVEVEPPGPYTSTARIVQRPPGSRAAMQVGQAIVPSPDLFIVSLSPPADGTAGVELLGERAATEAAARFVLCKNDPAHAAPTDEQVAALADVVNKVELGNDLTDGPALTYNVQFRSCGVNGADVGAVTGRILGSTSNGGFAPKECPAAPRG